MNRLNVTTILLVAVVGFVGWELYRKYAAPPVSPVSNNKGTTSGLDLAGQITGAVKSIFDGIGAIAKTTQTTNGGNDTSSSI